MMREIEGIIRAMGPGIKRLQLSEIQLFFISVLLMLEVGALYPHFLIYVYFFMFVNIFVVFSIAVMRGQGTK